MSVSFQIFFAFRLFLARKWQYILGCTGIFFGIFFIFFFQFLGNGIEQSLEEKLFAHKNILQVQPVPKTISFLERGLTDELKEEIEKLEGVKKVYTERSSVLPSFAQSTAMLSFPVDIAFIRGMDEELFMQQVEWKKDYNEVPVLVAPFALDFLNSFAEQIPGFSGFSPERLLGQKISITIGKSAFIPMPEAKNPFTISARIVGVSDLAPVVGIAFPENKFIEFVKKAESKLPEKYSKFYVEIDDISKQAEAQEWLEKKDLFVRSQQKSSENLSLSIFAIKLLFFIFSGIILFLSFLFLFSTLILSLLEARKTIGILRAIGLGFNTIGNIFLFQSFFLVASSFSIAIGAVLIAITYIENSLQKFSTSFSFFPESFFLISFFDIFIGLLITFIITFIIVRIATKKVFKSDPIELLLE